MTGSTGKTDISIVVSGEAGQGIKTVEALLIKICKEAGYYVFSTKEYMSRIRGGSNSTEIRVSSTKVSAFVSRIDLLVPFTSQSVEHLHDRISTETVIIGERQKIGKDLQLLDVPFTSLASEIGHPIFANIIAVGLISSLLGVDLQLVTEYLSKRFAGKEEEILSKNLAAVRAGFLEGRKIRDQVKLPQLKSNVRAGEKKLLLNGTDAVSLGALAGGCNFLSSYPMSPGTGVMTFLAKQAKRFGLLVEQAEDEISAVNMALGAAYAGARSLVTTSGGGFALMVEGVSLAGMLETPLVVHIGQRPGPATGLPTRTEQGDLNLVLHSGHGEFPRLIFAPGTLEEAFFLTKKAFNLADKYQVPVFILTDQHFLDSYYGLESPETDLLENEYWIVKSRNEYQRYKFTDDGISPRAVPGFGEGLVVVDSDEHDQAGHLTEDTNLRIKMVKKRLNKFALLPAEAVPPHFAGSEDFENLIIAWGSTYQVISEALREESFNNTAFLHFSQVFPVPLGISGILEKAGRIIAVENNATGQFANLLKLETGFEADCKILKFNGLPFSVEEIRSRLSEVLL